jgi:integrase
MSLRTRAPATARRLSLLLIAAGQSAMRRASVQAMRYEDIRRHVEAHFHGLLKRFHDEVAESGQLEDGRRNGLESSRMLAEASLEDFADITLLDGNDGLLSQFCAQSGISAEFAPKSRELFRMEIQRGYRSFLEATLGHNASFDRYDLRAPSIVAVQAPTDISPTMDNSELLLDVSEAYLSEGRRAGIWRPKTLMEKQDALELLREVIGNKPVSSVSKHDARKMKDVLFKLPKNRTKNAATRTLSLAQMLTIEDVERMSSRTLNGYLSHYQHFMGWAEKQGHCAVNVFEGLRVAKTTTVAADERRPFNAAQLRCLYEHLTENPEGLVKKDDHKWPVLIGMFSGARLNEIAQLLVTDVVQRDSVWCFDFNDEGDKALKNASSRRVVPIHQQLLDLGFAEYVALRSAEGASRLFSSLTYSKQNGYGRNVGRWFNESLLPALGLKEKALVFHSFRHTMVTILSRSDVPEPIVKSIVGHTQTGVTQTHYLKSGYTLEQLQRELNRFEF